MNKFKTVFLLGAGASKPYGLPLGSELKNKMIDQFRNPAAKNFLAANSFDQQSINEFIEVLKFGSFKTVDHLLELKIGYRKIGSYLIARTILSSEKHEKMFPARDWYPILFRKFDLGSDNNDAYKRVQFVTLNYDRSLEHFFNKSITYDLHDNSVHAAHERLKQIKIIHAHGSIGDYPNLGYGIVDELDEATVNKAAESIKIVSDKLEESQTFREAKKAIENADRVIFIGFGYNQATLSALFDTESRMKKEFIGTVVGLSRERISELEGFFNNKIRFEASNADKLIQEIDL
jgi:SIR2-like domain